MKKRKFIKVIKVDPGTHILCDHCGRCITCGDCGKLGCGLEIRKQIEKRKV